MLYYTCVVYIDAASGQFTRTPINMAVMEGARAQLNCTVNTGGTTRWHEHITDALGRALSDDDSLYTDQADIHRYSIVGQYNLVVHEVMLNDSGRYSCQERRYDNAYHAYIFIIGIIIIILFQGIIIDISFILSIYNTFYMAIILNKCTVFLTSADRE